MAFLGGVSVFFVFLFLVDERFCSICLGRGEEREGVGNIFSTYAQFLRHDIIRLSPKRTRGRRHGLVLFVPVRDVRPVDYRCGVDDGHGVGC